MEGDYGILQGNNHNVIFVTDDVKKDWWTKGPNQKDTFHEDLVNEFETYTNQQIIGITS